MTSFLPPLPRARCPFECLKRVTRYGSKQDMYILPTRCTGKPLNNGWCSEHRHAQQLLELGANVGYPRLQINIVLWIGEGRANWEAYAVRCPKHRFEQVQHAVRLLKKQAKETITSTV